MAVGGTSPVGSMLLKHVISHLRLVTKTPTNNFSCLGTLFTTPKELLRIVLQA